MDGTPEPRQDCHAGRRRHSRLRVNLPARLISLDGTFHAVLLDLSYKGAKLLLHADLRPGSETVMNWGPFEVFGQIKWITAEMCGLRFDQPLSSGVLIATRDLADATPQVDSRREAAREFVRGAIRL